MITMRASKCTQSIFNWSVLHPHIFYLRCASQLLLISPNILWSTSIILERNNRIIRAVSIINNHHLQKYGLRTMQIMHRENAHMQLIARALNIKKGENEIIRSIRDTQRCVSPSLPLCLHQTREGVHYFLFLISYF